MNQALTRAILIDEAAPQRPGAAAEEPGFGFQDVLSVVFSQRLFMLVIVLLTLAAGALFVYFQAPRYFAEAQVALGPRPGDDANVGSVGGVTTLPPASPMVESEMEILKSNDLMNRLIDTAGSKVVATDLGFASPDSFADAKLGTSQRRDLIQGLQAHLAVRRLQASNVIAIGFEAPTRASTVRLGNLLIDQYLASKADEREAAAARARDWLDRRIEQLAAEVQAKEAAVAAYRADMKLISVDGATLNEQQYFKLQGEVVAARADVAGKEARLQKTEQIIAAGGAADAVLDAVNSGTIQQLRQREAESAARLAEMRQKYADAHPALQQAVRDHAQILQQISEEVGRIKSSVENEVQVARSRLQVLERGLTQLESSLVDGNRAIVRLRELERDADASSSVYKDFMLKAREIAQQGSLQVVDARAVSRAIMPQKASTTSTAVWMSFFAAAGVFLALLGAMTRAAMNDRIVRPETIGRRIGVPALVSVPLIHRRQLRKMPPDERTPEDYLVSQPMTAFAESLRVLGASLISDLDSGSGLAVAVTSALAAEGKTTISLSMGRAAAMSGLRVLIIDCDARRPSLSAGLGGKPAVSVIDVMKGTATWRDAAVLDPLTAATVLPINPNLAEMQSLFRPEAMRRLLSSVRSEFDLIVMDCPPMLAVAETRWLASVADMTVIVTHWNQTRSSAVKTAVRDILRAKGRVAGIVLNRTDVAVTKRFSFSDSLYYGNAGKGYYTA